MRSTLFVVAFTLSSTLSVAASAQQTFRATRTDTAPAPVAAAVPLSRSDSAPADDSGASNESSAPLGDALFVTGSDAQRAPRFAPPPREIGLDVHGAAASTGGLGARSTSGVPLGGVGASLRFKPLPWLGVQGGIDYLAGRQEQDAARQDVAFTLAGLLFVNSHDPCQLYFVAAAGWGFANVGASASASESAASYRYLLGEAGLGLEVRLGQHAALDLDGRALARTQLDSGTGGATVAGGILFTSGITVYL